MNKEKLFAALEFGETLLKSAVFERKGGNAMPIVRKKLILEFPARISPARRVTRLREFLFGLVREMERVPEKIAVSLGGNLGAYTVEDWRMKLPGGALHAHRDKLRDYFQNLFIQHRDSGKSRLAYPVGVYANDYPVSVETQKTLLLPPAAELSFRTLVFTLDPETGAGLAEAKRSLGGLPIEFVPAPAAIAFAVAQGLGIREALFLLVDEPEATLSWIKEGSLFHAVSFPYNDFIPLEIIPNRSEAQVTAFGNSRGDSNTPREFLTGFMSALDTCYPLGPLPKILLLGGTGAGKKDFRAGLKNGNWMKEFSRYEAPDIRVAGAAAFFGGETLGGSLRGPEEAVLGALIYWTLHNQPLL